MTTIRVRTATSYHVSPRRLRRWRVGQEARQCHNAPGANVVRLGGASALFEHVPTFRETDPCPRD